MNTLIFQSSKNLSLGIELELQLINPLTFDLFPRSKDLIRNIQGTSYSELIKPEITQAMLEINSTVHQQVATLESEIHLISNYLANTAQNLGILFSGGGSHPFQHWHSRKIFPSPRFREVSRRYQYLAKRFTVFAQHTHIGCSNPDDALYLTHALSRYVPQLIALSASSPFYQGADTGYFSSRVNIVNSFPLYGVIPYVETWGEFTTYYYKMKELKIIESMKDFYWDIRPKPEFGTVEIRVCDTPLTIKKSIMMAAYIQTLARYLLLNKPHQLTPDLYLVYNYNRFQASRYGYEGDIIDPYTKAHVSLQEDILATLDLLKPHMRELKTEAYLKQLKEEILLKQNDAVRLREIYSHRNNFKEIVNFKSQLWLNSISSAH